MRRIPAFAALAGLTVLTLAGCADRPSADGTLVTAAPDTAPATGPAEAAVIAADASGAGAPAPASPTTPAPTTLPAPEPTVTVDVEIGPTSTVVSADVVAADAAADLFGSYAACSGLRGDAATWSLQVSNPAHDVTAVSILADAAIAAPGTFDAAFRVEFVNGASLDGNGTVTLAEGLRSGTFAATDADLRGSFECGGDPATVAATAAATGVGLLALVRQGSSERVLSVAEPYTPGVTECSPAGDRIRVVGDAGVGVPVEVAVEPAALTISVGAEPLTLDPARTTIAFADRVATFHAVTTAGLEIDGALSCA